MGDDSGSGISEWCENRCDSEIPISVSLNMRWSAKRNGFFRFGNLWQWYNVDLNGSNCVFSAGWGRLCDGSISTIFPFKFRFQNSNCRIQCIDCVCNLCIEALSPHQFALLWTNSIIYILSRLMFFFLVFVWCACVCRFGTLAWLKSDFLRHIDFMHIVKSSMKNVIPGYYSRIKR